MSTLGTLVDLLGEVPEAIGIITSLTRRIRDARGEDRAAIMAEVRKGAETSYGAFVRADARLVERFPEEIVRIPDAGEAGG